MRSQSLNVALTVTLTLLGARAWAQAEAPVPTPAPDSASSPDAVPPSSPAQDADQPDEQQRGTQQAGTIVGFELTGTLSEPKEVLEQVLRGVFPDGTPFVESGPADRLGVPIGTVPRARRALDSVGYHAAVTPRLVPGGVVLVVDLRPYDRVRYVFVSGNWPIRQDELQRRISIRPGRPLPMPGPERDQAIERERVRLLQFLQGEGYFDVSLRIDPVSRGSSPAAVDLYVRVSRGPAYPVGPVSVQGNSVIPSPDIEREFHHLDYRKLWTGPVPFTVRRLRDDAARVTDRYRDLGYVGARVSSTFDPEHSIDRRNKNVALTVTVRERKHIRVAFEGNRRKSASSLRDQLTLAERGSYDDYEASASADAIQRYYQETGFFFARVEWRRERLTANEDRLIFVIDEGPRLKVRSVTFQGNRAFSPSRLQEVVTVRTFPWLGYIGLGAGGYVTGRQIQLDAERLVEFYRSRGYPDAEARGEAATAPALFGMPGAAAAAAETVSRDSDEIHVRYTVTEGPLVFVRDMSFQSVGEGRIPYHPTYLRDHLSLRPGEPYTPGQLREDARRLERLMGDAGHPVATAEADIERDGDAVRVIWKIKPGPRIRVGPIFVRGNFITRPETITQWIPIRSGDYLTTWAFERGQRNLGFLQLFNNAAPISFPGKDEGQAVVPMVIEVEERHLQYNVLHLGGGLSTEQVAPGSDLPFGLFVRAGYDHRNLFGRGWNFGTSATYGTSLFRANANFLDRRFQGSLFRFDISGQYFQQATARLGDIRSWGGSIGFAREMYPGVDAGIHYNLRNTTYTEPLIRPSGANEDVRSINLGTTVSSLSANLQWLRLDNRLVPSHGFKVDVFAELAPRALSFGYADTSFVKLGVRWAVVLPLLSWLSLRHGIRYDQGFPIGGEPLLPKVERYFAGGDTTIRGYKLDRARVDETHFPFAGDRQFVQYRPIGGNLRILQNIDLQFPISPPWYGSVFFDNGVVADSLDGLGASQFRHGVGISPLLLKLPIGDLSFAWAWPLDPQVGDTRIGVLHVNIGLLF